MNSIPGAAQDRRADGLALSLVVLAVLVLYYTAPSGGAFYWSDAPRHAMNGVFVKDLIAAMPFDDPSGYAYGYYAKYPALTILFYPPLFYVLSAPFYALFGVSHETALWAVMAHYLAFGWGCYRLARLWIRPIPAVAMALTMMFLPEVAFWGRQVMLEVPAYAFAVWSAVFFVRHLRGGRQSHLLWAVALLVLGMYTKISVVFIALPFMAALLHARGLAVLREREVWLAGVLGAIALVPLAVLTLKFGQANVQSVAGVADRVAARSSLAAWTWYAEQWPGQLGWPLLALLMAVAVVALVRFRREAGRGPELTFWLAWFAAGYLFFSAIDLKEARHSVYILLALVLGAFWAVDRWAARWATMTMTAALALSAIGWTLLLRPVYYIDGYARAAAVLAERAPPNSMVLFSGYRDGSFTFNIRAQEQRPDLSVLRADKILLRVAVRRELGVEQKAMSDDQILDTLNRQAVHYLVVQPGFWNDLEVMRRFERLLQGPQFIEVMRIPTPANHKAHETELVVYRNLAAASSASGDRQIDLHIIGRSIGGRTKPP